MFFEAMGESNEGANRALGAGAAAAFPHSYQQGVILVVDAQVGW